MSEEAPIIEDGVRFPIKLENGDIIDRIRKARALEWIAQHHFNKYHSEMLEIWLILAQIHSLDLKKYKYTLTSKIPTIYYLGPEDREGLGVAGAALI